ncbi:MAG: glycosyltransferase family 4 protein [Candidatus Micrarchaeia archaeon]
MTKILAVMPRIARFPPSSGDEVRFFKLLQKEQENWGANAIVSTGKPVFSKKTISKSKVISVPLGVSLRTDKAPKIYSLIPFLKYVVYPFHLALFASTIFVKSMKNPAFIHAHTIEGGLAAFLPSKILNVPLVLDLHDVDSAKSMKIQKTNVLACSIFEYLEKLMIQNAQVVLATNKIQKKKAIAKGAKKVEIVPNGFDSAFFPLKKPSKNIVLYVGDLIAYQGVSTLIDAIELVSKKKPLVQLRIIGKGPQEEFLRKKSEKLKVNAVFLGLKTKTQVADEIRRSTVCVSPQLKNGFTNAAQPIKVLEYSACKKPVVSSDLDGAREILKNALFAKPNNAKDLAKKILQASANPKKYTSNVRGYTWNAAFKKLKASLSSYFQK